MVKWAAQLAATIEDPGSDFQPDLDPYFLQFLFLPVKCLQMFARYLQDVRRLTLKLR